MSNPQPGQQLRELLEKKPDLLDGFSEEEKLFLKFASDPVEWAQSLLNDPMYPGQPLGLRWYQQEMLACQARKKVYRCGRQIGKTVALAVEVVWAAVHNSDYPILIVCPYKSQVDIVWTQLEKLIKDSPLIEEAIMKITRNPYYIKFSNGSEIRGFTAGVRAGQKGESIRGQSAKLIVLDEMDYMGDETLGTIAGMTHSFPDTRFIASSTPTGKREQFYQYCKNKKLGWIEFYFPSSVSPNWVSLEKAHREGIPLEECTEYHNRMTVGDLTYIHEFDAEFGEEELGVFSVKHLESCVFEYQYNDWTKQYFDVEGILQKREIRKGSLNFYNPSNIYVLGVDWNSPENGTHLVVIEYMVDPPPNINGENWWKNSRGKCRVFYRESINVKELTQHEAVKRIIELNRQLPLDWLYVDKGFGAVQIEMLQSFAKNADKEIDRSIIEKLVPLDLGSNITITDPLTGAPSEKPLKPFIVDNAVRMIENHEIILPEFEDERKALIGQIREYRVKKRTQSGQPIYQGEDHILDAWMYALFGL